MISADVIEPAGPQAARQDRRRHRPAQTQRAQLQRLATGEPTHRRATVVEPLKIVHPCPLLFFAAAQ
jgi:hypothetical protein